MRKILSHLSQAWQDKPVDSEYDAPIAPLETIAGAMLALFVLMAAVTLCAQIVMAHAHALGLD